MGKKTQKQSLKSAKLEIYFVKQKIKQIIAVPFLMSLFSARAMWCIGFNFIMCRSTFVACLQLHKVAVMYPGIIVSFA